MTTSYARPPHPARFWLRISMLGATALAAAPAAAQYYGPYGYGAPYVYNAPPPPPYYYGEPAPYRPVRQLRPDAIVERLEDQGYDDVGRPRVNGGTYMVDATAPGGARVRLAVDAVRGVILNRVSLGNPRLRGDEDDDDEDRPRRRYGVVPANPPPPPAYGGVPDQPSRRAARPPAEPGAALPGPADPRLAPGAEAQPGAARDNRREAARSAPPSTKPFGTNPTTGGPGQPAGGASQPKPSQPVQARRPDAPRVEPGRPKVDPGGAPPAAKPPAEADARPSRPVRVIGGVTPMNAEPRGGEADLKNLPEPPPVTPPSGQP